MAAVAVVFRRALPRLSAAQWWVLTALLLVSAGTGLGVWAAMRPVDVPMLYIVRWNHSGKCTIAAEPPEGANFRLLWTGNLRQSANDKLREFMRGKRCR